MSEQKGRVFENATKHTESPSILEVQVEDVKDKKDQVTLIDVRRPDEWIGELGVIEGVQKLVLDELPQKINDLDKNAPTVFICRSGGRSAQACGFAQENGFKEVYNMKGGMIRWNEVKFPVERSS